MVTTSTQNVICKILKKKKRLFSAQIHQLSAPFIKIQKTQIKFTIQPTAAAVSKLMNLLTRMHFLLSVFMLF